MNNIYNEVLEKLTEIVVEQLDVEPQRVTLNTNFYNLYTNELDPIELLMAIEEVFEIEISDEEAEKLSTVESVLYFLSDKTDIITLKQIEIIRLQEKKEIKEREIKNLKIRIFKFLKSKDINQEILLKLLENDEITSNWEKISEFVKVVDQKSFTISEIAKYSFIFQNDFILSNVENIYQIVQFLENNKITVNEIISFINDGEIERIKNDIEAIKKSMEEKQDLIREKEVEINHKKSEIKSLEQIMENLNKKIGNLNEEIQNLQAKLNEFL
ncbi:MAG: hypothetical protein GW795_08695 [Cyanobacteria bacterium]|nr:hypothetical protein [Cyanobacteria bacterium CG_2015-16_32_12]NCO78225.1 hypothetical protein [Cyanobacteria bacterium CG_2015-22_32_23]NCQ03243.1 hypothetical protein [Cyanobacteria bacterium CG_2015-09_32_10]NCQ41951.1 hypothetical protein [Cyanobacteria bacterium CG_2015-04_32_10]NCS85699.1 hypothetical protein [Cyanobacteria bacterium CG_2015-02_32_10]